MRLRESKRGIVEKSAIRHLKMLTFSALLLFTFSGCHTRRSRGRRKGSTRTFFSSLPATTTKKVTRRKSYFQCCRESWDTPENTGQRVGVNRLTLFVRQLTRFCIVIFSNLFLVLPIFSRKTKELWLKSRRFEFSPVHILYILKKLLFNFAWQPTGFQHPHVFTYFQAQVPIHRNGNPFFVGPLSFSSKPNIQTTGELVANNKDGGVCRVARKQPQTRPYFFLSLNSVLYRRHHTHNARQQIGW